MVWKEQKKGRSNRLQLSDFWCLTASFSFLIALSMFSNVYSLLIIALCWSFVDDMNSLFAFQTKYTKQNLVLNNQPY